MIKAYYNEKDALHACHGVYIRGVRELIKDNWYECTKNVALPILLNSYEAYYNTTRGSAYTRTTEQVLEGLKKPVDDIIDGVLTVSVFSITTDSIYGILNDLTMKEWE